VSDTGTPTMAHGRAETANQTKGGRMQQTLKITANGVVVFYNNEIGVYDGTDNIGLGIDAAELVSVEPVSDKLVELHVRIPLGHELPDLIDHLDHEVF
jgi:hypothetical protein